MPRLKSLVSGIKRVHKQGVRAFDEGRSLVDKYQRWNEERTKVELERLERNLKRERLKVKLERKRAELEKLRRKRRPTLFY